jgi:hypothetical protein
MTRHALMQSAAFGGLVFVLFWPPLTWWLARWLRRHQADPIHGSESARVTRRVLLMGALWALLPATYAFAFWLLVCR